MMDHTEDPHKPNKEQKSPRFIRDRDETDQSDYYYDDSTNYEIYRGESDEPDKDDHDGQAPAGRTCRKAS